MNNVDKQYLELLQDILENGNYKQTRSGAVKSVFGRQMRFNLKEGLPLLTTKKVYVKGIIHELLWFLKGDTNIKYLVENKVNIWNDDAYRWYCELIKKHNELIQQDLVSFQKVNFQQKNILTKDEFLNEVLNGTSIVLVTRNSPSTYCKKVVVLTSKYTFGDLGPVYGKQWRSYGDKKIDQIQNIINTLKNNPDDRRMLCVAFNPDMIDEMALPPCHTMFQFYTRELSQLERLDWLCGHSNGEYDEWKYPTHEKLDELNVPRRELSISFSMRANDFCAGSPYNLTQYGLLAYMLCEVCNMVPGELVYFGGDVHVYENHFESAYEQLKRSGSDIIPKLKFGRKITNIDDFNYEDFIIEDYYPDGPIKYELNVGL